MSRKVAGIATKRWFKDSLTFSCTSCGKCCRGKANVFVNPSEATAAAEYLNIGLFDFFRKYTDEKVGPDGQSVLISLKSKPGKGGCVFLSDNKCSIYDARPTQCRTYPFWPQYMMGQEEWESERNRCEGINRVDPFDPKLSAIPAKDAITNLIISQVHDRGQGPDWTYEESKDYLEESMTTQSSLIEEFEEEFFTTHYSNVIYQGKRYKVIDATIPAAEEAVVAEENNNSGPVVDSGSDDSGTVSNNSNSRVSDKSGGTETTSKQATGLQTKGTQLRPQVVPSDYPVDPEYLKKLSKDPDMGSLLDIQDDNGHEAGGGTHDDDDSGDLPLTTYRRLVRVLPDSSNTAGAPEVTSTEPILEVQLDAIGFPDPRILLSNANKLKAIICETAVSQRESAGNELEAQKSRSCRVLLVGGSAGCVLPYYLDASLQGKSSADFNRAPTSAATADATASTTATGGTDDEVSPVKLHFDIVELQEDNEEDDNNEKAIIWKRYLTPAATLKNNTTQRIIRGRNITQALEELNSGLESNSEDQPEGNMKSSKPVTTGGETNMEIVLWDFRDSHTAGDVATVLSVLSDCISSGSSSSNSSSIRGGKGENQNRLSRMGVLQSEGTGAIAAVTVTGSHNEARNLLEKILKSVDQDTKFAHCILQVNEDHQARDLVIPVIGAVTGAVTGDDVTSESSIRDNAVSSSSSDKDDNDGDNDQDSGSYVILLVNGVGKDAVVKRIIAVATERDVAHLV